MYSSLTIPLSQIGDHMPRSRSSSTESQRQLLEAPSDLPHGRESGDTVQARNNVLHSIDQDTNTTSRGPEQSDFKTFRAEVFPGTITVNRHLLGHVSPGIVKCVISWLVVLALYVLVRHYKDQVLSPRTKALFDATVTALSIVLGLNIVSGLKGIALDLRWWFLGAERKSPHEEELILQCDSLTELTRLIFVSREILVVIVCVLWLSLNIMAQTGIAVLSLTWSANPGPTNIFRDSSIGHMLVPNMSVYASHSGRFSDINGYLSECFAAHILGDIASSYNYTNLPSKPLIDRPGAFSPAVFWNATDHWQYNFLDSAPLNSSSASASADSSSISMYTDHTVNVSGICQTPAFTSNSTELLRIITVTNTGEIVYFPLLAGFQESIFYLTTPILNEPRAKCGPRCGNIKVVETATGPPAPGSDPSSYQFFYYDCNITVSAATTNLSDTNAIVAAQAIALSGQLHPELFTSGGDIQFMSYNNGLPFGESQNNSATGMADLISRFAIGVVAAAAQTNPKVVLQGQAPVQGVRLELEQPLLFNLILILTATIHTVLFCSAVLFYSRLDVRKEVVLSQVDGERRFAIEFALKTSK